MHKGKQSPNLSEAGPKKWCLITGSRHLRSVPLQPAQTGPVGVPGERCQWVSGSTARSCSVPGWVCVLSQSISTTAPHKVGMCWSLLLWIEGNASCKLRLKEVREGFVLQNNSTKAGLRLLRFLWGLFSYHHLPLVWDYSSIWIAR